MARSTEKNYHLSKLNFLTDEEAAVVQHATAVMPIIERVLERELSAVETKLDSEENFALPAYNERMIDLLAQRRILKRITKLFKTIEE